MSGSDRDDLLFSMDEDVKPHKPKAKLKFPQERQVFTDFLKAHTCYEMIPASGKMVVLDVELPVKVAFRALIENQIKSAPLWDSTTNDYVGMITVTDFIEILRRFYRTRDQDPPNHHSLFSQEEYQIKTWREILSPSLPHLVSIHPDASIYEASQELLAHHIHRIPILDREENNTILQVLSHRRILVFMTANVSAEEKEVLMNRSIGELEIGTFNNVVTVLKDTPLFVVLDLLAERRISGVPLIDETGVVTAMYSKSDAARLASQTDIFDVLDQPVQQFIEPGSVFTCKASDTLHHVLVNTMLGCNARRVVCVDSTQRVRGIISLSDIAKFFLPVH